MPRPPRLSRRHFLRAVLSLVGLLLGGAFAVRNWGGTLKSRLERILTEPTLGDAARGPLPEAVVRALVAGTEALAAGDLSHRISVTGAREVADLAMAMLKIDAEGFDPLDRRMLGMIIENFDGGPVGVESLAAALSEERGTLEDVVEPYLIQQGYLVRSARGRMVTHRAYTHLGLKPPRQALSPDLFTDKTVPE